MTSKPFALGILKWPFPTFFVLWTFLSDQRFKKGAKNVRKCAKKCDFWLFLKKNSVSAILFIFKSSNYKCTLRFFVRGFLRLKNGAKNVQKCAKNCDFWGEGAKTENFDSAILFIFKSSNYECTLGFFVRGFLGSWGPKRLILADFGNFLRH